MPSKVIKEFEDATCNMSLPIVIALLSRVYCQIDKDGYLDALDHIEKAMAILLQEHEKDLHGSVSVQKLN